MVVVVHPPGASRVRGQIRTRPPPRAPRFSPVYLPRSRRTDSHNINLLSRKTYLSTKMTDCIPRRPQRGRAPQGLSVHNLLREDAACAPATWGGDQAEITQGRACCVRARLFSASRHGAPSRSRANARPSRRLRLALLRQQRAGERRAPVGAALVAALVRSEEGGPLHRRAVGPKFLDGVDEDELDGVAHDRHHVERCDCSRTARHP